MVFAAPPWAGWGHVLSGLPPLLSTASLMSVSGVPGSAAVDAGLSLASRSAAIAVLAAVPIFWGGLVSAAQRWRVLDRLPASDTDRRLARALGVYAAMALILGNVTVQAVRGPEPVRRPAAWRQLHEVSDLPFRALTLKVTDEANGLSTALAMYYLPGRNAAVFGRGVSLQDLSFDNVSKEQPLFIHNFRCEGVGHGDTVFVREVGCLLMAPPGMALGTSYPFDRTFLFVTFDRMTPRQAGGRAVETLIGAREWVSLPVRSADWRGNRLWSLPIALDFLDGQTVLFQEIALTESPRGAVAGTGAHAIETR